MPCLYKRAALHFMLFKIKLQLLRVQFVILKYTAKQLVIKLFYVTIATFICALQSIRFAQYI